MLGEESTNSSALPTFLPTLYSKFSLQVATTNSTSIVLCNEPERSLTEDALMMQTNKMNRMQKESSENEKMLMKPRQKIQCDTWTGTR